MLSMTIACCRDTSVSEIVEQPRDVVAQILSLLLRIQSLRTGPSHYPWFLEKPRDLIE